MQDNRTAGNRAVPYLAHAWPAKSALPASNSSPSACERQPLKTLRPGLLIVVVAIRPHIVSSHSDADGSVTERQGIFALFWIVRNRVPIGEDSSALLDAVRADRTVRLVDAFSASRTDQTARRSKWFRSD